MVIRSVRCFSAERQKKRCHLVGAVVRVVVGVVVGEVVGEVSSCREA